MEDHHTTKIQFMAKLDQMERQIVMLDTNMEERARYALKVHFMQSDMPTNGIVLVQKQPTQAGMGGGPTNPTKIKDDKQ
jgi:hypothetical protein